MTIDPTPATVESDIRHAFEDIAALVTTGRVTTAMPVTGFVTSQPPADRRWLFRIMERSGSRSARGNEFADVDYRCIALYWVGEAKEPVEIEADGIASSIHFELLQRPRLQSTGVYPRGVPGIRVEGIDGIKTTLVFDTAENAQKKFLSVQVEFTVPTSYTIPQLQFYE